VNRRVRFRPEAARELADAALWYEQRREGLGFEFLEIIERTLSVIRRWPQAAPRPLYIPEQLEIRRARVPRFPYGVVYVIEADFIAVLAIAHDSRRPNYWQAGQK